MELAALGRGYTSPNPMVGDVIVKDGHIISESYHERSGEWLFSGQSGSAAIEMVNL